MPLSVTRISFTSRNSIYTRDSTSLAIIDYREREGCFGALLTMGERERERERGKEGGSGHWGSQKSPRD